MSEPRRWKAFNDPYDGWCLDLDPLYGDDVEIEVIEAKAYDELLAENKKLTKERTAYRTLNSLLADNGTVCELESQLTEAQRMLKELAK